MASTITERATRATDEILSVVLGVAKPDTGHPLRLPIYRSIVSQLRALFDELLDQLTKRMIDETLQRVPSNIPASANLDDDTAALDAQLTYMARSIAKRLHNTCGLDVDALATETIKLELARLMLERIVSDTSQQSTTSDAPPSTLARPATAPEYYCDRCDYVGGKRERCPSCGASSSHLYEVL